MPPKRQSKAKAWDGSKDPPTLDMPADTGAAETLAGASGKGLGNFLDRVRQKSSRKSSAKHGGQVRGLPAAQQTAPNEAGACGASAVVFAERDAAPLSITAGQPGASGVPAGPAAHAEGAEDAARAVEEQSGSEWEWEEAESDGNEWEDAPSLAGDPSSSGTLSIDVDVPAGARAKARQRPPSAEERAAAKVVHQAHLLCLLARGLMHDSAANDPLLQALMLSRVEPQVLPRTHPTKGVAVAALHSLAAWFRETFTPLATDEAAKQAVAANGDPASTAPCQQDPCEVKGLEGLLERLRCIAAAGTGTAEELVTLLAALLRAHGLLVRTVRVLDALPMRLATKPYVPPQLRRPTRPKAANPTSPKPKTAASDAAAVHVPAAAAEAVPSKATGAGRAGRSAKGKRGQPNGAAPAAAQQAKRTRKPKAATTAAGAEVDANETTSTNDLPQTDASQAVGSMSDESGGQARKRARKGDVEFENQIAMALAATAAATSPGNANPSPHRHGRATLASASRLHSWDVHQGAIPDDVADKDGNDTHAHASHAPRRHGHPPPQRGKHQKRAPSLPTGTHGATWWRDSGATAQHVGNHWLEVYCDSAEAGRWVHLDPLLGAVDEPLRAERATVRNAPLSYVVAFAGQGAKDVTQRYVSSFIAAEKLRDSQWWEQTLRPLRASEVAATQQHHRAQHSAPSTHITYDATAAKSKAAADTAGAGPSGGGDAHGGRTVKGADRAMEMRRMREDAELKAKVAAEKAALPTTVDGFKRHSAFVLERHISKYQALKPGAKKAGLHRGEPYYERAALVDLHTAELWLRAGRAVEVEELEKPYKTAKKRNHKGASKPAGIDIAEDADNADLGSPSIASPEAPVTKLYGEWQTVAWEAPTAMNGIVPKNEHGNVLCPPFAAALPQGTVHLKLPRLGAICRQLSIDYAVAMCGFEIKGGRSVPVLDGVVVCEEHQEAVMEAYQEEERKREERAAAKQRAEADAKWRALLRALFARIRVHNAYSGGDPNASTAAAGDATFAEAAALLQGPAANGGAGSKASGAGAKQAKHGAQKGKARASGKAQPGPGGADDQSDAIKIDLSRDEGATEPTPSMQYAQPVLDGNAVGSPGKSDADGAQVIEEGGLYMRRVRGVKVEAEDF